MPFTGPAEDRQAIRELYDSYADATNRSHRADWLACWTDDALWRTHYFEDEGKAAIGARNDLLLANVSQATFLTQIGAIEVGGQIGGNVAKGRVYCLERLMMRGGGSHRLTGQYDDEIVREAGEWRFRRRIYTPLIEELPGETWF